MTNKNNKKNIGIILGSSAAVAVLTAGLIFGTAGCSTKQAQTGFKTTTVTVDKNSYNCKEDISVFNRCCKEGR